MDYIHVQAGRLDTLREKILQHLNAGYKLHGEIIQVTGEGPNSYCQPMICETPQPAPTGRVFVGPADKETLDVLETVQGYFNYTGSNDKVDYFVVEQYRSRAKQLLSNQIHVLRKREASFLESQQPSGSETKLRSFLEELDRLLNVISYDNELLESRAKNLISRARQYLEILPQKQNEWDDGDSYGPS